MVGLVILNICVFVQKASLVETSSHSLAFAVSLLALYPDVQYKLYEEVVGVWPTGIPTSSAISVGSLNEFLVSSFPTFYLGLQKRLSKTGI